MGGLLLEVFPPLSAPFGPPPIQGRGAFVESPPQDEDIMATMMALDPLAAHPEEEEQSSEPEFQPVPKDM